MSLWHYNQFSSSRKKKLHKELHSKIRTMKYLFHLINWGGGGAREVTLISNLRRIRKIVLVILSSWKAIWPNVSRLINPHILWLNITHLGICPKEITKNMKKSICSKVFSATFLVIVKIKYDGNRKYLI